MYIEGHKEYNIIPKLSINRGSITEMWLIMERLLDKNRSVREHEIRSKQQIGTDINSPHKFVKQ